MADASTSTSFASMIENEHPSTFEELMDKLSSSDYSSPITIIDQLKLYYFLDKKEHQKLCNLLLASPSSCSCLKELTVRGKKNIADGEVASCYARLLRATPSLQKLTFYKTRLGGEGFRRIVTSLHFSALTSLSILRDESIGGQDGIRHLVPMLNPSSSTTYPLLHLESLGLYSVGMDSQAVALLAKSLQTNTSLHHLNISANDIGDVGMEHIAHMLHFKTSLSSLSIGYTHIRELGVKRIVQTLLSYASLHSLNISGNEIGNLGVEAISQLLLSNSSLKYLDLSLTGLSMPSAKHLAIALAQNTTLLSLDISYNELGEEGMQLMFPDTTTLQELSCKGALRIFKAFYNILENSTTLIFLDISCNKETELSRVQELFRALGNNRCLQSLNLELCDVLKGDKVASWILDALQINSWLTHIDLQYTPLDREGHTVVIEAQLKRIEEENAMGFPQLQKAKPNRIRVFLCGLPNAGKTTLKESMTLASKGRLYCMWHAVTHVWSHSRNERTRGIDIGHILDSGTSISLWDLAGQEDFYSFHDFMFPDISNAGSPSLFLILCKPMNQDGSHKSVQQVGREIKYWLRFISSKARQSELFKPTVAIVFTHKDKQSSSSNISSIIMSINTLRVDFQPRLDLSNSVFHVNAQSSRSCKKIFQYLRSTTSNILERWPRTYASCNKVGHLLHEWKVEHPETPIMPMSDFISLCNNVQELKETSDLSSASEGTLSEEQKLAAHTLTNVGDILYFPDLEYVLVDLVWFCERLIGQMIKCEGINNEEKSANEQEELLKWDQFATIVHASLSNKRGASGDPQAQAMLIMQIMQKLNLCFSRNTCTDSAPDVFIPANLTLKDESKSWTVRDPISNPTMLGRRIQCLDQEHTILTPNFFPQIQIALYNSFFEDKSIKCQLMKDFILIIDKDHGMEIHLEFHGHAIDYELNSSLQRNSNNENPPVYIDVLLKSSQKTDKALKHLQVIVIKEIMDFCAKWRGCQGVTLIEGILRPECVKQPEKYTVKQCVLISTLKDKLMKIPISEMCNNIYYWEEFHSLGREFEFTKDLLGEEAFMDVIKQRNKDVQVVEAELEIEAQKRHQLSSVETCKGLLNRSLSTNESIIRSHTFLDNAEPSNQAARRGKVLTDDSKISFHGFRVILREELKPIKEEMSEMHKKIDTLICMEEKVVNELRSQVRALLDIVNEQRAPFQHNTPHLFYFTQTNGRMRERVVRLLAPIDCYQLRFFCEGLPSSLSSLVANGRCRQQQHEIESDYKGLVVWFSRSERLRNAMPYLNKVLKLVTMVAKVGAHVVAGAEDMVPDLAKLPALVFDSAVIDVSAIKLNALLGPEVLQLDHPSSQQRQSAEQWLVDILIENQCCKGKDIAETFGLYRVRHRATTKVSWVCHAHMKHPEFDPYPIYQT